jgi:2-oxoglutarate ferredoxin oxidoreductase subunit alpha
MSVTAKQFEEREAIVVRFAGDSGDGMQIVGEQFTDSSAFAGNDLATLPDFPAEIRAPAGTLPGVSGFQIQFGSRKIHTPGDSPDALVAMNPAALKVNLPDLVKGGLLIVNTEAFKKANLKKAGYEENPLDDEALERDYKLVKINITDLTKEALADSSLKPSDKTRCKNFFALGFTYFVYSRPLEPTVEFLEKKWGKRLPDVANANIKTLRAGYYFGETTEISQNRYQVARAENLPGTYRKINGNDALAYGLISGAQSAGKELLFSGYPITPASSILEGLAGMKHFGVKTVQAEDEIAAIGVALGASFTGSIGVTATSGPGMCLKGEFMGLTAITELPMVICDIQRGGPSTGLPTKTEQGDLLMSYFGRHGELPIPVVASTSPSDCFFAAREAMRIALEYNCPVILLSELYLAIGSEPWRLPDISSLPKITPNVIEPGEEYIPYKRDPKTLARKLAFPGMAGYEHRIGGLEKDESGSVSYDPMNHEDMSKLRAEKVQRIADSLPPTPVNGEKTGKLLVLGWGGTEGAILSAVNRMQSEGFSVSSVVLRHLNPLPNDLEEILNGFDKILIPELNFGQLSFLIQAKYLKETISYNKVQGRPFTVNELLNKIQEII